MAKSTASKSSRKRSAARRAAPAPVVSSESDAARSPDDPLLRAMSLRVSDRGRERRLSQAEVELALISGEHARTLETYFGEAEYAELRRLAGQATHRKRNPGPRVLVLPGILGSTLAEVKGNNSLNTLWVDLLEMVIGRLTRLALPESGRRYQANGVIESTYLKLKLWLQAEGFNADFHPFDWRQSIPDLGRELAARIAADPAEEIFLVAHSMGGLVSRLALQQPAGQKVKRLIMLGTPNYGSFAPAMVYRSAYPFLKKLALLADWKNDATDLGRIFTTHPGLAQMLPHRAKFDTHDLFDLDKWPTTGVRPLAPLLKAALAAHHELAEAIIPEKMIMIAGVDRETTVGLRVDPVKNEFIFERSRAGDGTVPLDFAVLPKVLTYYHAEEHGALPKNTTVQKAVVDLLRTGATGLLADRWERTRADARIEISESDLRAKAEAQQKRGRNEMSASDLRAIIAEFAAPATASDVSLGDSTPAGASPADLQRWESLVVGRRRQRRIDVQLARGSLTQVKSRAYMLGIFQNVEPGGAALAIDNLMDGTLREFRQRRMFAAGAGEVLVVPTGRNEVTADYVVFVGLGHFDTFNLQVLETVAENVARTLSRMDIEEFATVAIGAGTGIDVVSAMGALLRGFFRGLDDADPKHSFRGITFCEVDEVRFEQLKWTLYRLWSTPLCDGVEVMLREIQLPPAPVPRRGTGAGLAIPPCIYLNVRARREGRTGNQLSFETSLLTTGAKAAVLSGEVKVSATALTKLLEEIEDNKFKHAYLPKFGAELAALVLDEAVAAGLEGCAGNHVVVVHDAEASRIPWETLCINGKFPALAGGMSRRYIADNLSVAKWLEQRREDEWLDVLLVVNPTNDLAGAEEEAKRIKQLFNASQHVHLTVIEREAATRARLRTEFASGMYDILHYAGHAYFDPNQPSRSGIVCSDGNLTGAELVALGNLPSLVFFNACESARVRARVTDKGAHASKDIRDRIERNAGLAEAFMRAGVANYMGTYWPVGDEGASSFARVFYESVLVGETLVTALGKGRAAIEQIRSVDWADYVFYGSVDFAVKKAPPV